MSRIKKRGRDMEQSVDRYYWGRLNQKYQDWYNNYDLSDKISISATSYHPDNEEDIQWLQQQFDKIPELYIADGHHRSASAELLHDEYKDDGNEKLNYFKTKINLL
jgi:uncharacterized protein (DUF1015 family)